MPESKVKGSKADGEHCRIAMNVRQAAAEAGIGRDAIYEAIREEKLEARKLGRRTIITREALQAFIATLPKLDLQQDRAA